MPWIKANLVSDFCLNSGKCHIKSPCDLLWLVGTQLQCNPASWQPCLYDHLVITTILFWPKRQKKTESFFYYFEDPVSASFLLLWPGLYGPKVVALTEFHYTANFWWISGLVSSLPEIMDRTMHVQYPDTEKSWICECLVIPFINFSINFNSF